MADNFHFDMTGVALKDALSIAFTHHAKAVGWAEQPADDKHGCRLVLFWTDTNDRCVPLPAPMDAEAVEPFVRAWLATADYSKQPDHDGDNHKGWRVYNEAWGHVGTWEAFVAIEPVWLMYGK